jgi:hypothetical protein
MQARTPVVPEILSLLRNLVARKWVAIVLFKLNWLLLVLGQQRWLLVVVCCTLPLQVLAVFSMNANQDAKHRVLLHCLLFAGLGVLMDQVLSFTGVLSFPGLWLPAWLVVLWLAFALVLPHVSGFLQRLPVYAWSVLGALGGTLSYRAGAALGAVEFGQSPWISSIVLALAWAVLLPLWRLLALRGTSARVLPQVAVCACGLIMLQFAPSPARAAEADLALVGSGHYRFLAWPIYDITLRAAKQPFEFPRTVPFELSVEYKRGFSAEQISAETHRQWRKQQIEVSADWLQWLHRSVPDVAAGDTLTLRVDDRYASHFFHNGKLTNTVTDLGFSIAFAGIWLAANTSAPHLRGQLLGETR